MRDAVPPSAVRQSAASGPLGCCDAQGCGPCLSKSLIKTCLQLHGLLCFAHVALQQGFSASCLVPQFELLFACSRSSIFCTESASFFVCGISSLPCSTSDKTINPKMLNRNGELNPGPWTSKAPGRKNPFNVSSGLGHCGIALQVETRLPR